MHAQAYTHSHIDSVNKKYKKFWKHHKIPEFVSLSNFIVMLFFLVLVLQIII